MNSGIQSMKHVSKTEYVGPYQIMATRNQSFSLTVNSYGRSVCKSSKKNSGDSKKAPSSHHESQD